MVERYEEIKAISLCTAGSVGAAFSIKRLTTPDNGNVAIFKDAEHTIENIGLPRGARLRKRMVTQLRSTRSMTILWDASTETYSINGSIETGPVG